ncbi:hypothetical protein M514_12116 [Trichuris suis]|uniref:Uncharacterized protein n=1 Tax=Trichuris suis TaxID=68888 RepID=A0A085MXB2_9BILA|nr:hypothetical protein M513_12116 [Trichuris suis]KFD61858.1 hypothetical protein M514_12116 [Trichuris suis]
MLRFWKAHLYQRSGCSTTRKHETLRVADGVQFDANCSKRLPHIENVNAGYKSYILCAMIARPAEDIFLSNLNLLSNGIRPSDLYGFTKRAHVAVKTQDWPERVVGGWKGIGHKVTWLEIKETKR